MKNAINKLGAKQVYEQVVAISKTIQIPEKLHIDYVCKVCCDISEIAPDMNSGKNRICCLLKSVLKYG